MVPLAPYFCCLLHPFVTGIEMNTALLTQRWSFDSSDFPAWFLLMLNFLIYLKTHPIMLHIYWVIWITQLISDKYDIQKHIPCHSWDLLSIYSYWFRLNLGYTHFFFCTELFTYSCCNLLRYSDIISQLHVQSWSPPWCMYPATALQSWPCSYPRDSGRLAVHVVSITSAPQWLYSDYACPGSPTNSISTRITR